MAEGTGQIYTLIPKVMKAIGAIEKGRQNQQQGYRFRGIDEVMNALHGPLCEHGVFYATEVIEREQVERQTAKGNPLFYTTVKARFTFYAPDASSIAVTTVGEAMDSADKSSNKAMSAALKYALLQLFCIPTEDQEDADAVTHEVAPKQQDALANDAKFKAAVGAAFKARGFTATQQTEALAAWRTKHSYATATAAPLEDRHKLIDAIGKGAFDKFKAPKEAAV